jgi:hypothetical protein
MRGLTKALSGEVRVLLVEVGALRDEGRRLQQCIRSTPVWVASSCANEESACVRPEV